MIFRGMKRTGLAKTVSILLIFAFSLYGTSFAALEKETEPPVEVDVSAPISVEEVGIAIDAGTIKSKFQGTSGKTVIHIQDAHCNFEAQGNINKMLDQLFKEQGVKMISVEGAEGIVDTAWFKAFPDAEIRQEVATYFMKKGEITGAEYFSINSDYDGTIFGAETKEYYIENLKAFTDVYPYQRAIERYFADTNAIATRLKSIIYPQDLKELDSKIRAFENKEIELSEFAEYLNKAANKKGIDIASTPNFKKLIDTLEYEGKIDFDIVDSERSKYIDLLAKKLEKKQMTELVAQSIRFKKGHIKAVDFYSYLRDLARQEKIQMVQEYPNLFYYYIYTKIYDGIDNEGLFREIDTIERSLKKKMFTSELEEKLDRYSEMVDMFVDLVNIELTNEDYDLFKSYADEFSLEDVITFYGQLVDRYNLHYSLEGIPVEINENIPKMISFYEIAMKRDNALISNTLERMDEEGKDRCVLIAGGFHTRGIKNILQERGVSYVVVTPKITKDVETPYIKVLTNQRTSLEDIITESAAMPGKDIRTSKEKITDNVSDLLSPLYRIGYAITMHLDPEQRENLRKLSEEIGKVPGVEFTFEEATVRTFEEAVSLLTAKWLDKVREKMVDQLGMTRQEAIDEFNMFVEDPALWGMIQGMYLAKYDDYFTETETKTAPSEEVRDRIKTEFDKYRNKVRETPGTGAMGRPLTLDEAMRYDSQILRKSFGNGTYWWVPADDIREGFRFGVHEGIHYAIREVFSEQELERMNDVYAHPGRWNEETKDHTAIQAHIDAFIFGEMEKSEEGRADLVTLGRHELAHLDIHNVKEIARDILKEKKKKNLTAKDIYKDVKKRLRKLYPKDIAEEMFKHWRLWVEAGSPEGQKQEDFINDVLGYNVGHIEAKIKAMLEVHEKALENKKANIADLEAIVENSEGPKVVIAITNPGDEDVVQERIDELKSVLFRKDGDVTVMAHPEETRRGQLLGLKDALESWKENHGDFDRDRVFLVINLPGKGTRTSPLTHREHGIKPNISVLINANGEWLTGATASLYTWTLVAKTLEEKGFKGVACKWADEAQVAANRLKDIDIDLKGVDIVRFGSKVIVTNELAKNKEFQNAEEEDGTFVAQVRRRDRPDLLKALGVEDTPEARAMVHIGSPAFSYEFIDAFMEVFADVPEESWLDVDGYLIEALTLKRDSELTPEERKERIRTWDSEYREENRKGEKGMKEVLENCPDFYERCQEVKRILNEKRGRPANAPLNIKAIDFGEQLSWYDIGLLDKAREAFYVVNRKTPEGEFARGFAGIEDAKVDEYGNRIVGNCYYPKDGSVRNSTLINSRIFGTDVEITSAVIAESDLGNAKIGPESVVYGSTIPDLDMGTRSLAYKVIERKLFVPNRAVYTSLPENPLDLDKIKKEGLEPWLALMVDEEGKEINVGEGKYYYEAQPFGNPKAFNVMREVVRKRDPNIPIDLIEKTIDENVRKPLLQEMLAEVDRKEYMESKFEPIGFGTSGMRGLDEELTHAEVFVNTQGDIDTLLNHDVPEARVKRGDIVIIGEDLRPSSPEIRRAVIAGVLSKELIPVFVGKQPSPTIANIARRHGRAAIVITGSHIPFGRNGIKFYRADGELLKTDEPDILQNVQVNRDAEYKLNWEESIFNMNGAFKGAEALSPQQKAFLEEVDRVSALAVKPSDIIKDFEGKTPTEIAEQMYINRYVDAFGEDALKGEEVVFWRQSAVGRDLLTKVFKALGAKVYSEPKDMRLADDEFLPVDTEKITPEILEKVKQIAERYKKKNKKYPKYIVSTDGDSDRPAVFFVSEEGKVTFFPGDKLGVITTKQLVSLGARITDFVLPDTCNSSAINILQNEMGINVTPDKVGSPYMVKTMRDRMAADENAVCVACEGNGGYLVGNDITLNNGRVLPALDTRDAALPVVSFLLFAKENNYPSGSEINALFPRHTSASAVDNKTPGLEQYNAVLGGKLIQMLSPVQQITARGSSSSKVSVERVDFDGEKVTAYEKVKDSEGREVYVPVTVTERTISDLREVREFLMQFFTEERGFTGGITRLQYTNGVKIYFDNTDTPQIRPSSNAPELRMYAEASTQERADEIVELRNQIYPEIVKHMLKDRVPSTVKKRSTPGKYTAGAPVYEDVLTIKPLSNGERVIPVAERRQHTEEVVIARKPKTGEEKGELVVFDRMEVLTNEPVDVPTLITESLQGRPVKLTVEEAAVKINERDDVEADETKEFVLDEDTFKKITKIDTGERAVLTVTSDLTPREKVAYESLTQIAEAFRGVTGVKVRIHAADTMFYESAKADIGTLAWTENILQGIVGETNTVEIVPYTARMGLDDLARKEIDLKGEVVDVLIAADVHLTSKELNKNKKVREFVEKARVLAIPAAALEFENGWDFNLETTGWATVLGAINPANIQNVEDETSPASIFHDFLTRVLKKKMVDERGEEQPITREHLYGLLPYEKVEGYLSQIKDQSIVAAIKGGTISRMALLIKNILFTMPIEAFKPGEALRSRLGVLWSA